MYIYMYVYMLHTYIYWINTDTMINDASRTTQEGRRMKASLEKYSTLTLLQGFERVVQGLHVRGCWRPNVNFIF